MSWKKNYLLVGAFLCLSMPTINAQSIKNEVQIIEGAYGIEKKRIIEQTMKTRGGSWVKKRLFLIHDYVIGYQSLTDAKASEITSRCFSNDEALARLHMQYYKKIKKALSPLKTAQFVQIEGYLQKAARIQLQSQLPFIGELVPIGANVNVNDT